MASQLAQQYFKVQSSIKAVESANALQLKQTATTAITECSVLMRMMINEIEVLNKKIGGAHADH